MRNTSRPRISSLILQEISPSGKLPERDVAQRHAEILGDPFREGRLAVPLKIFRSFMELRFKLVLGRMLR